MPLRFALDAERREPPSATMLLTPATAEEVSAAIRAHSRLRPVGAQTKPRLCAAEDGVTLVSTRALTGITEYDPGEFTFTALAGTPLREITAALAEKGQYLPWDPPFVASGATLGGTIAAGLSGPGRFRFGGLRDFILAVRFADGEGRLLRAGAKVVKNAAGFDVPKFLVGSLGRYGVIVEATFKVFPQPVSRLTLRVPCESIAQAVERLATAANSRWELEALDCVPADSALVARLAGPADANTALAAEITAKWPGTTVLPHNDAEAWWAAAREFHWAHEVLAKIPLTLGKLPAFLDALAPIPDTEARISAGGDVAWLSTSAGQIPALDPLLQTQSLTALVLRGPAPLQLGLHTPTPIQSRIHSVFDPANKFS
jgi:glycolate oxidase FAD binding subunit